MYISYILVKKNFLLRMLGKNILPYDLEFISKNGEIIIGRIHGSPVKDAGGRIVGDIVLIEDVTERRKVEDELKKSEEKFKQLYERAPIPYHTLSPTSTITDVNEKWCQIFGYKKKEVIGKSIFGATQIP